jgi:beta-galactosidase
MPNVKNFETRYDIYEQGYIHISCKIEPKKDLIRFGQTMLVNGQLSEVTWVGRGPHENYIDRKASAHIGEYTKPINEMHHHYLRPQENGNRCDVRYTKVFNEHTDIEIASQEKPFEMSIWPYQFKDLEKATHIHELDIVIEEYKKHLEMNKEVYYQLNIDAGQRGVGGDVPAIAMLKEPYKMKKGKPYMLDYWIKC